MSNNEYTQIGWIGLGQMGNPMVTRLLDAGIEVGVYNRSPDKTTDLQTKGAKVYPSRAELIRAYPVIFLMVSDYAAILDLLDEEAPSPRPKTSLSKTSSKRRADSSPKPPSLARLSPPPTAHC